MSILSDKFRQIALKLVNRFGHTCIIRKVYNDVNNDDPTEAAYVTEDFLVNAAIIEFEKDQVDGVQVIRGDKQIIVAKDENCPEVIDPGDLFIDGNYCYKIIPNIEIYTVNGIVCAYILQGRM